jgi:nitrogenase molybdenum-iron protein NifN
MNEKLRNNPYAVVNPCNVCAPLGATLAFKGIEGSMTIIHGSQGCATYIRRYLISHFREPVDVASSSFNETTAIFGGGENLRKALDSVIRQYNPSIIAVSTTCLSETIGDDVKAWIRRYIADHAAGKIPHIVTVPTPSYSGGHEAGYHQAIKEAIEVLGTPGDAACDIAVLPPLLSPEDIRILKETLALSGLKSVMLPDYSLTLDGEAWSQFTPIAPGGTSLPDFSAITGARAALELGAGTMLRPAGELLKNKFGVAVTRMSIPIGIKASDRFYEMLSTLSGRTAPHIRTFERGRLLDAYADGNKYVYGKRVALFGDEDLVAALMLWCAEIGMKPVVVATGRGSKRLREDLAAHTGDPMLDEVSICDDADFDTIDTMMQTANIDLCIGTSKGYRVARSLGIPLVRVGFPVHDRFGAARIATCGYKGTLSLYDRVVNTLLESTQQASPVGYSYM